MIERAKYENKIDVERLIKNYAREENLQKNKEILVKFILF
jgi:hypothetical protein